MTSRDFCYWLQGYLEISGAGIEPKAVSVTEPSNITFGQLDIIQKHLHLVFEHEIDPSFGDKKEQSKLNKIHGDKVIRC